jgi:vanillate O-demethylase monooxygenase subunit
VLTRTVLDIPMVAFRTDAGKMAVLDNRCPHRFAPLSEGKREGDTIACPYHGLVFNTAGQCVRNPHGAATSTLAVASFPVLERHKAVWIWVGQQEPDENLLPDLSFIDAAPETAQLRLHTAVQANYELLADNILDLSHADYLHASSLGSGFQHAGQVDSGRTCRSLHRLAFGQRRCAAGLQPGIAGQAVDRGGLVCAGADGPARWRASGGQAERGIDTLNLHNMTPETLTSTHYFSCNTRNFLIDDAAFNAVLREQLIHAFQVEDKPMIEKVQRQMGTPDLWSLGPKMLPIDKGAVLARRRVARLIEAAE